MVPADVLAAARLNAEMRAIAERAASGVEQRSARPPVAIDPAEVAEDGAAQMDAAETAADALGVPKVVPPPAYQPIAPFGLTFTFNTQTGGYAGVTMSDATFWWNDAGTLTEKTASVGQLTLSGTVYLNVTLDAQGKFASSAVGMSASGDLSLKLYQLDQNGVVKDYRHAMVVLCANKEELEFAPAPFDIGETKRDAQPGEDGDEHGKVVVSGIVNCKFFWDGAEKTLPDFPIPGGTATVYLNCVGTASQSASAVNGYTWTFAMSTSEVSTGGNIYRNYKLYDFNAGEVSMDWRSTFLALYSNTAKEVEPDGVSIDKIPDAAPGATPTGDEGKLEIKGFKSAISSELTLSEDATTLEFLARAPGNPKSLAFRTLKIPAADSTTVKSGTIVATGVTWDTASGANQYSIKITRGNLKVGDGNNGTTKGQIYIEEDTQGTLTQRIPSVPFTPSMAQGS